MQFSAKEVFLMLRDVGASNETIAAKLGVTVRCVQQWEQLRKKGDLLKKKPIPGRPSLASDRDLRALKYEVKSNGLRRADTMSRGVGLNVSNRTARKYVRKCGMRYLARPKVPYLTKIHMKNRKKWCISMMKLTPDFWDRVVWTDETMVCLLNAYGPAKAWTTKELKYTGINPRPRSQGGGPKVMFWGCFLSSGTGLFIPIRGIMNSVSYVELLKNHVIPWMHKKERELHVKLVLQQDNAPCHRSAMVREFLAANNIEVLEWPSKSPDLNPIENMWSYLKDAIGRTFPIVTNLNELKTLAQRIWTQITPQYCASLVESFKHRMKECKTYFGRPTSH